MTPTDPTPLPAPPRYTLTLTRWRFPHSAGHSPRRSTCLSLAHSYLIFHKPIRNSEIRNSFYALRTPIPLSTYSRAIKTQPRPIPAPPPAIPIHGSHPHLAIPASIPTLLATCRHATYPPGCIPAYPDTIRAGCGGPSGARPSKPSIGSAPAQARAVSFLYNTRRVYKKTESVL